MVRTESTEEALDGPKDMTLVQAFAPYALLSLMTIIVLTVAPVNAFLSKFQLSISVPETSTGYGFVNAASDAFSPIVPFTHASMFLFLSAVIGLIYYKKHGWIQAGGTKAIFGRSITMTMPSGMAVIGLVIMSKIMSGTGQTERDRG